MTTTIKLYHWQTSSYPRHKATCDLLAAILPLIDTFVETYMGRYQRPVFESGFKMNIQELKDNDDSAPSLIKDYIFFRDQERVILFLNSTLGSPRFRDCFNIQDPDDLFYILDDFTGISVALNIHNQDDIVSQ